MTDNYKLLTRISEHSSFDGCWIIVKSLVNGLAAELFKMHQRHIYLVYPEISIFEALISNGKMGFRMLIKDPVKAEPQESP